MTNNSGQSMFEVVLALFIITMILVAVVLLSTLSVSKALFSRNQNQGTKYSQEAVEWLRSQKEKNYSDFVNFSQTSSYCLDTLSFGNTGPCGQSEFITNTNFIRQVNFDTSIVSGKKIITATVITYWQDAKGYHETRSVTEFSDIREK